jgi:hypothetical protein
MSSGSASFEYVLFPKAEQSWADRGFRISMEDMKILSRRMAMDTAVCSYATPPYSGPCGRRSVVEDHSKQIEAHTAVPRRSVIAG